MEAKWNGGAKSRPALTLLSSRQGSKRLNKGSAPSSDADSPPILPNSVESPLASKSNSRTSSFKIKESNRGKSPASPVDRSPVHDSPEIGAESLLQAGSSSRAYESAKKKILFLASKGEWTTLEQALKTIEQVAAANKNNPIDAQPLATIQDEVAYSTDNRRMNDWSLNNIYPRDSLIKKGYRFHATDVRRQR